MSGAVMDGSSGWLWDDVKVAFERVHCPLERDVGRMAGQALSINDSASHLQLSPGAQVTQAGGFHFTSSLISLHEVVIALD